MEIYSMVYATNRTSAIGLEPVAPFVGSKPLLRNLHLWKVFLYMEPSQEAGIFWYTDVFGMLRFPLWDPLYFSQRKTNKQNPPLRILLVIYMCEDRMTAIQVSLWAGHLTLLLGPMEFQTASSPVDLGDSLDRIVVKRTHGQGSQGTRNRDPRWRCQLRTQTRKSDPWRDSKTREAGTLTTALDVGI